MMQGYGVPGVEMGQRTCSESQELTHDVQVYATTSHGKVCKRQDRLIKPGLQSIYHAGYASVRLCEGDG